MITIQFHWVLKDDDIVLSPSLMGKCGAQQVSRTIKTKQTTTIKTICKQISDLNDLITALIFYTVGNTFQNPTYSFPY